MLGVTAVETSVRVQSGAALLLCQQRQRHSQGLSSSSETSRLESSSVSAGGVGLSLGLGSVPQDPAPWVLWEVSAQWQ